MEFVRLAGAVVLVLCSVTATNAATTPPSTTTGGGDAHSLPCIQKLMPCQPYLHLATPPPPTCCMPLNEIVLKDVTCLCAVFNNVDMLKSLNLTKENALNLPNACGAKADVSKCKATSSGGTTPSSTTTSPPATTTTPSASSTGSNSTGDSASSTAKSSDSAPAISFVGLSFASAMVAAFFF